MTGAAVAQLDTVKAPPSILEAPPLPVMTEDALFWRLVSYGLLAFIVVGIAALAWYLNRNSANDSDAPMQDAQSSSPRTSDPKLMPAHITVLSHEMRTQVNGILGLAEVLKREGPRQDQQETLEAIRSTASNLLSLLNGALDFDKLQSGKGKIIIKQVNVADFFQQLELVFKALATAKGLKLEFNIGPGLPVLFPTDELRLTQILNNLLSNSIKFTEKGKVSLNVSYVGQQLELQVQDSGIGIGAEHLPTLFEPYGSASSLTTRKYGGSGLGLSITATIVKLLGGDIQVSSQAGFGTRFTVHIPPAADTITPLLPSTEVDHATVSHEANLKGITVLVVEDANSNRLMYQRLIEHAGGQVLPTASGAEALKAVANEQPCIALLDMDLPDTNGVTLAGELLALPQCKHLCLVALSGYAKEESPVTVPDDLFKAYLQKPVEPEQLLATLQQLCEGRNLVATA